MTPEYSTCSKRAYHLARVLVCSILAMNVLLALTDTSTPFIASLSVTGDGSINVTSAPGEDIWLNAVSVNHLVASLRNLTSGNSAIQADRSAMKSSLESLKAQVSALVAERNGTATPTTSSSVPTTATSPIMMTTTTTATTTTTTTTANSICSISQSPQSFSTAFLSFATFTSDDGTAYTIAEQTSGSVLYRYDANGTFTSSQTLWSPTSGIVDKVHAFKVGSVQYVALPFIFDDMTNTNYRCELFVFNETTKLLASTQNISTFGVLGVSDITTPSGVTYLAVSNHRNQAGSYGIPSYIMQFNNATMQFEHFQNITTNGAYPPEFFRIDSDIFLAIPNSFNGSSYLTDSFIYKLNTTSNLFSPSQIIATNGTTYMKPWKRNSHHYLSFVNRNGGYTDTFVFDNVQGHFVNITDGNRLFSSNPIGAAVMDIANSTYMIVSPWGVDARIYRWNDAQARFEQTQQLVVSSGWLFPHFFAISADSFLALSNRVYKFCGGQFVLA
jgi:hypothetical protein